MCDPAFPHFFKYGGARHALHLRHLQNVRRKIIQIVDNPRALAAQDYQWAQRYARLFPGLEAKWVVAVEAQFSQVGIHLRQLWDDQFLIQIQRRIQYPRLQVIGEKVMLNACPLCRMTSVELLRLPEGEPVIPQARWRWFLIGSIYPEICTHRLPVDEISWRIVQNTLFLQSQGK